MDVLAIVVGTIVVVWVLASAVRTVVIPRPERSTLGWGIFVAMRWGAHFTAHRFKSEERRERIRQWRERRQDRLQREQGAPEVEESPETASDIEAPPEISE